MEKVYVGNFFIGLFHGSSALALPADIAYSYISAWVEGRCSGPATKTWSNSVVFERAFCTYVKEGLCALRTVGGLTQSHVVDGSAAVGGSRFENLVPGGPQVLTM